MLPGLSQHQYESQCYLPQPLVSAVLSALIGVVGMVAMGVSRSLHGGICRDGLEEEAYPLQVD